MSYWARRPSHYYMYTKRTLAKSVRDRISSSGFVSLPRGGFPSRYLNPWFKGPGAFGAGDIAGQRAAGWRAMRLGWT